jgi:hypothetical protein
LKRGTHAPPFSNNWKGHLAFPKQRPREKEKGSFDPREKEIEGEDFSLRFFIQKS